MFFIMLLRGLVRCIIVWSLYFQYIDVFLGCVVINFLMRLIEKVLNDDRSLASNAKKITYVLIAASFGWVFIQYDSAGQAWYFYTLDGPSAVMYAAFAFYIVSSFAKIMTVASRGQGSRFAIYRIRKCLYNTYVSLAICTSIYYSSEVVELLDKQSSVTISDTTKFDNSTVIRCEEKDRGDEVLDSLYDTTAFSLDCAYDIWRRNRVNILAWLQVKILFGLTWRLNHCKNKLKRRVYSFNYAQSDELTGLLMTLSQVLKYLALFLAVTLWVDDIKDWYVMPISSAGLLTFYVIVEDVYEKHLYYMARLIRVS